MFLRMETNAIDGVSRHNVALALHNTARRSETILDEYLATACRVKEGGHHRDR